MTRIYELFVYCWVDELRGNHPWFKTKHNRKLWREGDHLVRLGHLGSNSDPPNLFDVR